MNSRRHKLGCAITPTSKRSREKIVPVQISSSSEMKTSPVRQPIPRQYCIVRASLYARLFTKVNEEEQQVGTGSTVHEPVPRCTVESHQRPAFTYKHCDVSEIFHHAPMVYWSSSSRRWNGPGGNSNNSDCQIRPQDADQVHAARQ